MKRVRDRDLASVRVHEHVCARVCARVRAARRGAS
jgi:hypothetical protein